MKFLARKFLYSNFILQPLFQTAQHFYQKREGSGSGTLVAGDYYFRNLHPQDDEVGDGTTSVTVLASELIREAEKLIDMRIHPQTIIAGWRKATQVRLKSRVAEIGPDQVRSDFTMALKNLYFQVGYFYLLERRMVVTALN